MSTNCKLHLLSAAWHGCDREMLRSTFERRTVPNRHLYIFIKGPATAAESPPFSKNHKSQYQSMRTTSRLCSAISTVQIQYHTFHPGTMPHNPQQHCTLQSAQVISASVPYCGHHTVQPAQAPAISSRSHPRP